MRFLPVALAIVTLTTAPGQAAAQRSKPYITLSPSPQPLLTFSDAGRLQNSRTALAGMFHQAPDYRYEGAAIGAIVVGATFGVVGHALCENSDNASKNCTWGAIKVGALGIVTGGLLGALIGGMLPKQAAAPSPSSP